MSVSSIAGGVIRRRFKEAWITSKATGSNRRSTNHNMYNKNIREQRERERERERSHAHESWIVKQARALNQYTNSYCQVLGLSLQCRPSMHDRSHGRATACFPRSWAKHCWQRHSSKAKCFSSISTSNDATLYMTIPSTGKVFPKVLRGVNQACTLPPIKSSLTISSGTTGCSSHMREVLSNIMCHDSMSLDSFTHYFLDELSGLSGEHACWLSRPLNLRSWIAVNLCCLALMLSDARTCPPAPTKDSEIAGSSIKCVRNWKSSMFIHHERSVAFKTGKAFGVTMERPCQ